MLNNDGVGRDGRRSAFGAVPSLERAIVSAQPCIADAGALVDAVEIFQADPDLRLLPVLDRHHKPACLYRRAARERESVDRVIREIEAKQDHRP